MISSFLTYTILSLNLRSFTCLLQFALTKRLEESRNLVHYRNRICLQKVYKQASQRRDKSVAPFKHLRLPMSTFEGQWQYCFKPILSLEKLGLKQGSSIFKLFYPCFMSILRLFYPVFCLFKGYFQPIAIHIPILSLF